MPDVVFGEAQYCPTNVEVPLSTLPQDPSEETGTRTPPRIFVVEDSAMLRERLLETLVEWGEVEIVGSAETEAAAQAALRQNNWDVLFLDIQLAQGSGLDVLRGIASRRKSDSLVIVLTNHVNATLRARAVGLGADYFLDKAYDFARIKPILTEFSARSHVSPPRGDDSVH